MRTRGTILAAVLVITALASTALVSLLYVVRGRVQAARAEARGEQAYAAALSGVRAAAAVLESSDRAMAFWYENPEVFRHQLVTDDGANRWYFTVYAPAPAAGAAEEGEPRYGLGDEAGKVHLATADEAVLLALPNMTPELADALLDYTDRDDDARPFGAERAWYADLPVPYVPKNRPLDTLEELLMVRGFNGRIVYGEDANLNGLLEANEDDSDDNFPPDNRDGELDTGLAGTATVWSEDPNTTADGGPRIDLNGDRAADEIEALGLPAETARFVRLYRAEGNEFEHPSQLLEMEYTLTEDPPEEFRDLEEGDTIVSGVGAEELATVVDRFKTGEGSGPVRGLVNVNTAPQRVLEVLGLEESAARMAVEMRGDLPPETTATIAWLYTERVVDAEAFKQVAPKLTARSYQFRVRSVGFGWPCGQYRVVEAVLDVSGPQPRIRYFRDLTRLGMPFRIDPVELEGLR